MRSFIVSITLLAALVAVSAAQPVQDQSFDEVHAAGAEPCGPGGLHTTWQSDTNSGIAYAQARPTPDFLGWSG